MIDTVSFHVIVVSKNCHIYGAEIVFSSSPLIIISYFFLSIYYYISYVSLLSTFAFMIYNDRCERTFPRL